MTSTTFLEIAVPLDADSVKERPYCTDLYLRRHINGVEIGIRSNKFIDYVWVTLPSAELHKMVDFVAPRDEQDQ